MRKPAAWLTGCLQPDHSAQTCCDSRQHRTRLKVSGSSPLPGVTVSTVACAVRATAAPWPAACSGCKPGTRKTSGHCLPGQWGDRQDDALGQHQGASFDGLAAATDVQHQAAAAICSDTPQSAAAGERLTVMRGNQCSHCRTAAVPAKQLPQQTEKAPAHIAPARPSARSGPTPHA